MMSIYTQTGIVLVCSVGLQYLSILLCKKWGICIDRATTDRPQGMHRTATPRSGGLGIFLMVALVLMMYPDPGQYLLISLMPCFITGFIEDLGPEITPSIRLIIVSIGAALAMMLLGVYIDDIGLVQLPLFVAVPFTIFAVAGVTNAMNVIDGLNGLTSGISVIAFAIFGIAAYLHGDAVLFGVSTLLAVTVLGFFVWNFPFGKIFLGDSGAYTIGFLLAQISILLVSRNPEISPWFPVLVLAYPIFETLFSIIRRKFVRNGSAFEADKVHLHSLIFRKFDISNSTTSLWVLVPDILVGAIALHFRASPQLLGGVLFLLGLMYLLAYQRILLSGLEDRVISRDPESLSIDLFGEKSMGQWKLITLLMGLCVVFRLYLLWNTHVFGTDGEIYLWNAYILEHGRFFEEFSISHHPLYPSLIVFFHTFIPDWIAAGYTVSIFFSTMTVLFVYLLFKSLFSKDVAVLSSLVFIFHPYIEDLHTDIMTGAVFLFFLMGAIYFFYEFLEKLSWKWIMGAGLFASLSFLTRVEGLLLLALFPLFLVILAVFSGRVPKKRKRYFSGAGLLVFFPILALIPYFALVEFQITSLTNIGALNSFLTVLKSMSFQLEPTQVERYNKMVEEGLKLFYWHLLLLFFVGVFRKPAATNLKKWLYFALPVMYFTGIIIVLQKMDISHRYLVPGVFLLSPLMAIGLITVIQKWTGGDQGANARMNARILAFIFVLGMLPKTIGERRLDQLGMKQAAHWVQTHDHEASHDPEKGPKIISKYRKAAYYAGGQFVSIDRSTSLRKHLQNVQADYLIITEEEMEHLDTFQNLDQYPFLQKIRVFPSPPRTREEVKKATLYRISLSGKKKS